MVPLSLLHKQLQKKVLDVLDGILLNLEYCVINSNHLNVLVILIVFGKACNAMLLHQPFLLVLPCQLQSQKGSAIMLFTARHLQLAIRHSGFQVRHVILRAL